MVLTNVIIIEYPALEGTHKEHQTTPGLAHDSPKTLCARGQQRWLRDWTTTYKDRLSDLGLSTQRDFRLENGRLRGKLINVYSSMSI